MQRRGEELASPEFLPYGIAFDVEKLSWELDFFTKHFLEAYRGVTLGPAERDALRAEFAVLVRELASEPRVLCHRDYHSRNLMLHESQLFIIDFQDARLGPDTYDLVSLLRDSYVDLAEQTVEELIAYFLALKGTTGAEREFRNRFDVMALQRNLKALGTFGYQTTARRNPVYIQYIPRTLRYVRNNLGTPAPLQPHVGIARGARGRVSVSGWIERSGFAVHVRGWVRGSMFGAGYHELRTRPRGPNAAPRTNKNSPRAIDWFFHHRLATAVAIRFGISTHLYHDQELTRDHLAAIASYGFEAVEVFATRSHFDYHDASSIERLAGWLNETGLALHGIHAPITDRLSPGDKWGAVISNAVSDAGTGQEARGRMAEPPLRRKLLLRREGDAICS